METGSIKMTLPPEVLVALASLGGMVAGAIGTVIAALFANRSAKQKSSTEYELGMTQAQREWVQLQIESMRSEINSNRTHYENVISTLHKEHREELKKQEAHCQSRLDILTRQVMTLTAQLKAYSTDLRKAGVCITHPDFEAEDGSP